MNDISPFIDVDDESRLDKRLEHASYYIVFMADDDGIPYVKPHVGGVIAGHAIDGWVRELQIDSYHIRAKHYETWITSGRVKLFNTYATDEEIALLDEDSLYDF